MNNILFPYKWSLKKYPAEGIIKNNLNVFSCFACAGGSSMGYKLAGYNILGYNEIDKRMADIYDLNHNPDPEFCFIEDIRIFKDRKNLPIELYNLDILDGSPPCSSFSMAGRREKDWGKKKFFREGQTKQILDDLFFHFIDIGEKLQPKIIIIENVKGLLLGNAKGYILQIKKQLDKAGYDVQLFLLNAATMGVPQRRERCFFIARRKKLKWKDLILSFSQKPISYGKIKTGNGEKISSYNDFNKYWKFRKFGDRGFQKIAERKYKIKTRWNTKLIYENDVCSTIASCEGSKLYQFKEPYEISEKDLITIGTFPFDFNFGKEKIKYIIGMSVPPVMIAHISYEIYNQWLSI